MRKHIGFRIDIRHSLRKIQIHPYAINHSQKYHNNRCQHFHPLYFPAQQVTHQAKVCRTQHNRKDHRIHLPGLLPSACNKACRCPADAASRTGKTTEDDKRAECVKNKIDSHCIERHRHCRHAIFFHILNNPSQNPFKKFLHSFPSLPMSLS